MSYRELFVSPSPVFAGSESSYEEADYVILGVPFDLTSTYRSGSRFAPLAVREASLNMETYSFRAGTDVEELRVHDLGDLHVAGDVDETLRRVELVIKDILAVDKMPVILGGEHTVTLGAMRGVGRDVAVVSFDAHLDLRGEYLGISLSQTTFMRRLQEQIKPRKILEVGVRAACSEELDYAERVGIQFFGVQQIRKHGVGKTVKKIEKSLRGSDRTYLTIDMDVLDPAFAPAVQNPEPDGLPMDIFLDLLCGLCDHRVVGFDLVELTPHYDQGITALHASKITFEVLCHIEKARERQ
ncbi:agmatinase [Candidatus Bathyarchaeota archaeon]|nr:agmatinase [Candidatus Bathyarchaeota archaeon]NIU81187.1 agmatinase [Candidatus Bathyarchaeota archaeon]NIV67826.1 agmatinase [Candidatus Bathyarchaeota archaeon]NIW16615.1 agmatinase [Candidatus Bathyarchaeota archaeon]NIW34427.1 agmatinase [Candidatus Bathyarchaeota archaeon]